MPALAIRDEISSAELRQRSRRENSGRISARLSFGHTETRHREKTQCASSGLTTNAPYKSCPTSPSSEED